MPAMRAFVSLLLLTLAACGSSGSKDSMTHPAAAALGREYVLGFGETLNLEGGISLEFTSLAEDSRCPTGVQCIWEGNGRILLTATTPRGVNSLELNTNARFATRAIFDSYAVELRNLAPYPTSVSQSGSGAPSASAYEATLFVGNAQ
jgi:hypothetical protein